MKPIVYYCLVVLTGAAMLTPAHAAEPSAPATPDASITEEAAMQPISTCLWFEDKAEEAAEFYCSIFPDSRITGIVRCGDSGPGPAGSVLTVSFELSGREFLGLNGGPMFKFSEAVSFIVPCDTQAEIDRYWDALLADGGSPMQCGWLRDRYGVTWQVVPAKIVEWMSGDPAAAQRVQAAFMEMVKFDLAACEAAFEGKE